jgi:hypothetical protein
MTSFVKQHRSTLFIVNRNLEEFRVECYYLERKVSGGVCVAMANVSIPPIVCAAKGREVFEEKSFTIEALLLQDRDCLLNFVALVGLKSVRSQQKGSVTDQQSKQGSSEYPRYPLEQTSFLYGHTCYWFRGSGFHSRLAGQRRSAAPAHFVGAGVD